MKQINLMGKSKNNEMTLILGKYKFSGIYFFGIIHKVGGGGVKVLNGIECDIRIYE